VVENPADRPYLLSPGLEKSHFVRQDDAGEAAFQFVFLGMIMVFVTIGIIAFFTFKERDFLYFSALTFCFAMNGFLLTYVHHLYLEPRGVWDTFLLRIPFLSFLSIFFYLFIANRLDLRQRSYRLNRAYKWGSIAGAFLFLPFYFSDILSWKILSAASTSMVLLVFAMVVIVQAKRKRHAEANSLLLSMSILILSGIISSILWIFAPEQAQNSHIGQIGLFAFAAYLLYSLFKRITSIRLARIKAQVEKEKSDELLFNVLPEEIALELKDTGNSEAKQIDHVSVLFTDFKGFTKLSDVLSAHHLIDELQYCFEAFDQIVEEYGIEKIKTIGDAYMAAGGLPVPTATSTRNTVLAALKMQKVIKQRQQAMEAEGKSFFEMRVGIHTGPVVAGVIGVKRYQYDIWGNTVNIASRMESAGAVAKVNISQATYELIKDEADFKFENRGKIAAKGKGEMEMYFVSLKNESIV
jgi:class 3 adenylate cyclase